MIHSLPTGIVTFLFTDIEGSTQLWERYPEAMKPALAHHDRILRQAIESHEGRVVKTTGDGCHAAFASAADALDAALDAQRRLQSPGHRPPTTTPLNNDPLIRIRIGLNTGEAELREGDYYGPAVNRAARIMSIGHGGQILVSSLTAELAAGRRATGDATTAFTLRDLGDHRLRDLSRPERIYQVVVDDLPAEFPPLHSLEVYPGNLPVQLTSFVGRERELTEVKRLLTNTRLLTLTGPGGTGKTRLSLQAAADVQTDYAHGAWLAELAPLNDPALIPAAVGGLFALAPQPGLPLMAVLTDYLRGKQLLLILDNCEHLVEACARLAADLLPVCPRLTILASSREGLGVPGETTYHVPTLGLPEVNDTTATAICRYDAADLFLQRARAAQPTFAITDQNAAAVGQIVRRLDGIPLAIELAAARVRMLAPEQIAARLDDRFRLLTGGSRTALPRQQTLRALIDWSYTLLFPEETALFRRLGVFAGSWTLEAAEEVAGGRWPVASERKLEQSIGGEDVLDLVAGLVNKSLVVVEDIPLADDFLTPAFLPSGPLASPRYRFLETIRQYAREKLFESGEGEMMRDRHLDYFEAKLAEGGLAKLSADGVAQIKSQIWLDVAGHVDALAREADDIRAAMEWALGRDPERALLMAAQRGLAVSMTMANSEGRFWITQALAAVESMPPGEGVTAFRRRELRALGYLTLGLNALSQGDGPAAVAAFGRAAELADESGNRPLLASALVQRSLAAGWMNDDIAVVDGQRAAALFEELNELMGAGQALGQMAEFFARRGDLDRAQLLADQSLASLKQSDHPYASAASYLLGSRMALAMGHMTTAEAQFRAGAAEFSRLGNQNFAAILRSDLGHVLRQVGSLREAFDIYTESIREWQYLGRRSAVANMLENFAFIARAEGQPQRAARLLGAADAMREEIHIDMGAWEREEYDREMATLRASLPREAFAAEWAAGRALTLDEAVDFAVA